MFWCHLECECWWLIWFVSLFTQNSPPKKNRHQFEVCLTWTCHANNGFSKGVEKSSRLTPSLCREENKVLKMKISVAKPELVMQAFCLSGLPSAICAGTSSRHRRLCWGFCEQGSSGMQGAVMGPLRQGLFQETQEARSKAPAWPVVSLVSPVLWEASSTGWRAENVAEKSVDV